MNQPLATITSAPMIITRSGAARLQRPGPVQRPDERHPRKEREHSAKEEDLYDGDVTARELCRSITGRHQSKTETGETGAED